MIENLKGDTKMAIVMKSAIEEIEAGMSQVAERAAERVANGGSKRFVSNTIVLLKHNQIATIRPVYNMDESIVMWMHDKYKNTDASLCATKDGYPAPISALCAEKLNEQACTYCVNARENKLEANREAFVPVYVYKIEENGQLVTFKNQDGEMKPVKGFRMLRLKMGSAILGILMAVYRDADYQNDITCCNFTISRMDTPGQGKQPPKVNYNCTPKPPTPMEPNLKAAIPARKNFYEALEEVYPVKVLQSAVSAQPLNALDTITAAYKVGGTIAVSSTPETSPEDFTF
jgi:hypothetical protein